MQAAMLDDMHRESFDEEKPDAAYLLDIEEMAQDIHGQGSLTGPAEARHLFS